MKENVIELLNDLKDICENQKKYIEKISKEKKIVGCLLEYTPIELVHSMGFHPLGLWGEDTDIANANKYLPSFYCFPLQSILEAGIKGDFNYVDAIIIPGLCDSLKAMGQNWKVAVKNIKFIPLVYPQNRNLESAIDYLEHEYKNIIAELENINGVKFDKNCLVESIKVYNRRSLSMNKLMEIIKDHLDIITPEIRHYLNKSALIMDVNEHLQYIEKIIKGLEKLPKHKSHNKKVILTGIMADSPILLSAIQSNNLDVIADDLAQESRQFRTIVTIDNENPIRSLSYKWRDMKGCSLLHSERRERISMLMGMVKNENANGVIFVNTAFCDPEEFDYPIIKKEFDDNSILNTIIQLHRGEGSNEQINTRIQGFKEILYL